MTGPNDPKPDDPIPIPPEPKPVPMCLHLLRGCAAMSALTAPHVCLG